MPQVLHGNFAPGQTSLAEENFADERGGSSMARRDPEYGYPSLGGAIDFATTSSCSYLEILRYLDHPHPVCREGVLDETSLPGWLSQDLSEPNLVAPSTNRQQPSGGIRLLLGVCGFNSSRGCQIIPFQDELFAALEIRFHLPKHFKKAMIGNISTAFTFSSQGPYDKSTTCFVLRQGIYQPGYYQIALSYDRQRNLTHGLILAKTKDHEFPKLISGLKEQQMHSQQPLLLAALVTELVIDSCGDRISASDQRLNGLEETMGQHEFVNRPKGNPLEIDFISTTSILNAISRSLGVETMRVGSLLIALESILDNSRKMTKEPNGLAMMEEFIGYQTNACRNLLLRAEYQTKRVQTQIAVVYQFMAQKDSKVNIELAKDTSLLARLSTEDSHVMKTIAIESKKDSSAMKTIAILTMLFLPGTFLANPHFVDETLQALFAMPSFSWDVDGAPVIRPGFKYYWAVAIPLTFLVLVLWSLAMLLPWRSWLSKLRTGPDKNTVDSGLASVL